MTNAEAKGCLVSGQPVVYHDHRGDISYKCVRGITYRRHRHGIAVLLELLDGTEKSTITVPVADVDPIGDVYGVYNQIANLALQMPDGEADGVV